jgi:GT2 family glycosyltransferase
VIADLSICIPTYNRARLLATCLAHLAGFADRGFEVVIGDNASSDDTPAVIAQWRERFAHAIHVRHRENVGYLRNMDAIVRRATRRYVYVLSDDDLVFEDALQLATSVLDASPRVVAVVGGYLSVRTLDPTLRVDYAGAVAQVLPRGGQAALLANSALADGHPVLRRETFERHCAYRERVNLIPLYCELLAHGDVVAVDRPFFQHLTNADSLTSRMAEPWFIDLVNADLEFALSGLGTRAPAAGLEAARQALLPTIYFQAARMSIGAGQAMQAWFFLRRHAAVAGLPDAVALPFERSFVHELLCERVVRVVADAEHAVVHVLTDARCEAVAAAVRRALPEVRIVAVEARATEADDVDLLLCATHADGVAAVPRATRHVALDDLFAQFRLSDHAAQLGAAAGRVTVEYREVEVQARSGAASDAFARLVAPYSEAQAA